MERKACDVISKSNIANENDVPCCEGHHPHMMLVEDIKKKTPKTEILYDLAELYKIFGDTTRIRILYLLFEAEMCV